MYFIIGCYHCTFSRSLFLSMDDSEIVVGIDLGTTNSEIYTYRNKQLEIIPGPNQIRITPSRVFVNPDSTQDSISFLTGPRARALQRRYPGNEIYEPKRLIGRTMDDQYVVQDLHFYPFKIVEGDNKAPLYSVQSTKVPEGVTLSAIDVDAEILRTISNYRKNIRKAVITVPAYFRKEQIEATKQAGSRAGLEVLECIPEPVAAAIAYAVSHHVSDQTIVVYDLGGGTFDCCVVHIENGQFKVLSSEGHSHLGGADFDNAIVRSIRDRIKKQDPKHDVFSRRNDLRNLKGIAEKAKITLSSEMTYPINFTTTDPVTREAFTYQAELTRAEFNSLIERDVKRTIEYISRSLEQLGYTISNVDEVVLVGGSTRIPLVQEMLANFFHKDRMDTTLVNSDEAVAQGAAIFADELMRGNNMLLESKVFQKIWGESVTPFGDLLFSIPYKILADYGCGLQRIFSQGHRFPDFGYLRVNRNAPLLYSSIKKAQVNVFKEEDGKQECIGVLSMDVYERIPTDTKCLALSFIYKNDGRLSVTVTNTVDNSSEQINMICRGDSLDFQEERNLWRKQYEVEQKWEKVMEKLCKAGNSDILNKRRKRMFEISEWFEEIPYEEEANVDRVLNELDELEKICSVCSKFQTIAEFSLVHHLSI